MICWKCNKEFSDFEIFRTSECPICSADLHCCKACKFYSTGSHNDCKESSAEFVSDKEKSNFCDYYSVNKDIKKTDTSKKDAARDAFNALFGGGLCL